MKVKCKDNLLTSLEIGKEYKVIHYKVFTISKKIIILYYINLKGTKQYYHSERFE